MRDLGVGMIPVVDNHDARRLTGVITDRDIAVRCVARHHELGCRVRDHMTGHALHTVDPDADVTRVIETMELGPQRPLDVVRVLERVSEPAHALR